MRGGSSGQWSTTGDFRDLIDNRDEKVTFPQVDTKHLH